MFARSKDARVIRRQTVDSASDRANPGDNEIVRARSPASEVLTLADDKDFGGDPYNSTGQHAVLGAIKTS